MPFLRNRGFEIALGVVWLVAMANAYLRLTWTAESDHTPYVTGLDPNCYYAFAHSIAFDGDLNFSNQYEHIARTQPKWLAEQFAALIAENPEQPPNRFPAGAGLVSVPVLWVARGILRSAAPFSPIFVLLHLWVQVTLGVLALWVVHWSLRRWFERGMASIAVWAAVLCGPMAYYLFYDPAMPHLASLFFAALAVAVWVKSRDASGWRAVACGAGFGVYYGISLMIRPYNLPVGLLAAEPLVAALLAKRRDRIGDGARFVAAAMVASILAFVPQVLIWKAQYGSPIANPQGHDLLAFPLHAAQVLFSRRHGLLFWAPAFVLAVAGLVIGLRRMRHPSVVFLAVILGAIWMMGTWRIWWLGVSFGMRGFVDFIYVFAFGFAVLASAAMQKFGARARVVAIELVVLFALVNFHLMTAFRSGSIYVDGPLYWLDSVSYGKAYKAQLLRDVRTWTEFDEENRARLW